MALISLAVHMKKLWVLGHAPIDSETDKHICHISHCEIKSHRIWRIWKPIPIR